MGVELILNGAATTLTSPPDSPLLWALRDEKAFVGVKFGCGAGVCGACTVHIDGEHRRACQTTVAEVAHKTVTTIEGLSGPIAQAVCAAWIKAQVPQCGYCQPGFVMATTSVIAADPAQSRAAVLAQLTNLCRCGSYDAIRVAVGYALENLAETARAAEKGAAAPDLSLTGGTH